MTESLKDIFSAKQEYSTKFVDKYNRLLSYSIDRDDFSEPVVSEELIKNGFSPTYPDGKKFAVVLSHDIDLLYWNRKKKQVIKNIAKSLYSNDKNLMINSCKSIFKDTIYPEYQIENIIEIEEKYKAKSTFFFLAVDKNNSAYNYDISKQKRVLQLVKETGNELGLHGSYVAYNNFEQLFDEKKRLEDACGYEIKGYRNHNLNFDIKTTWSILEKAGFEYDATFGLADRVGFRNGMCHPFRPYDLTNNKFYNLIEFPLHVMDVSMFQYMKLSYNQSFEVFKKIVEKVEKNRGVLSFLWHNTNMSGEMLEFYRQCLEYLLKRNAYFETHTAIFDIYMKNSYFDDIQKIVDKL